MGLRLQAHNKFVLVVRNSIASLPALKVSTFETRQLYQKGARGIEHVTLLKHKKRLSTMKQSTNMNAINHIKILVSVTLKITILLLLPFVVFTFITSKTDMIKGIRSFVVLTGSMEPALPVGSIVYVQKPKFYKIGDVISFSNKAGQTITHRISDIINKKNVLYYQTKGDANRAIDNELITQNSIIGKRIASVPFVGKLIATIRTPLGFGLLIVLPTFMFIGFELWNIKKEIEKNVERKFTQRVEAGIMNQELGVKNHE